VGLLWPELPDAAARHNLRQALANLRQALSDRTAQTPLLLIDREMIRLNPAGDYELGGSIRASPLTDTPSTGRS
jgi:DNA-binding SARP family transcriptional activator